MQLKNKATDAAAREFIQKRIQSARWLIESIEQPPQYAPQSRAGDHRSPEGFPRQGPEFIEPLKMQQIADRVHVHVTTVSRAVDDKWVQTLAWNLRTQTVLRRRHDHRRRRGSRLGHDQAEAARDHRQGRQAESALRRGNRRGTGPPRFPVARRTVTKYRRTLRIPSSRQRKQF